MENNDNLNIWIIDDDSIKELNISVEKFRKGLADFLRKLLAATDFSDQNLSAEVDEIELDVLLTKMGEFALASNIANNLTGRFLRLKLRKIGSSWQVKSMQLEGKPVPSHTASTNTNKNSPSTNAEPFYQTLTSTQTQGLVIFIINVSGSMSFPATNQKSKIQCTEDVLFTILREMVFRSTKGMRVSPRYRLAMYAYNDECYDLLGGIKTIDKVAQLRVPSLTPLRSTDTEKVLTKVYNLISNELPSCTDCPAPLIIHITDGQYTGNSPYEIIDKIKSLRNLDGNVLISTIYFGNIFSDDSVSQDENWQNWTGINSSNTLNSFGQEIYNTSSVIPETYRTMFIERGYAIAKDSKMIFPGTALELCEMLSPMSMSTPVSRG